MEYCICWAMEMATEAEKSLMRQKEDHYLISSPMI